MCMIRAFDLRTMSHAANQSVLPLLFRSAWRIRTCAEKSGKRVSPWHWLAGAAGSYFLPGKFGAVGEAASVCLDAEVGAGHTVFLVKGQV